MGFDQLKQYMPGSVAAKQQFPGSLLCKCSFAALQKIVYKEPDLKTQGVKRVCGDKQAQLRS